MADSICRLCEEPLKYETQFYKDPMDDGYVHAGCLEELAEVNKQRYQTPEVAA